MVAALPLGAASQGAGGIKRYHQLPSAAIIRMAVAAGRLVGA